LSTKGDTIIERGLQSFDTDTGNIMVLYLAKFHLREA